MYFEMRYLFLMLEIGVLFRDCCFSFMKNFMNDLIYEYNDSIFFYILLPLPLGRGSDDLASALTLVVSPLSSSESGARRVAG